MTFKKYLLVSAAILAAAGGTTANAADGTITFHGTVTNSACTAVASVGGGGGGGSSDPANAVVNLPRVSTTSLNAAAGTYAGHTTFYIQLTGCAAATGLSNVHALFTTARTPESDSTVMANTATTTPASDVAVAILGPNGTAQIDVNGGYRGADNVALPTTEGPVTLNYRAAYKSLSTSVTAGFVTAVADFVITYN